MHRFHTVLLFTRFSPEVMQADVEEAIRLMHACQSSLRHSERQIQQARATDPITQVFKLIKEYAAKQGTTEVKYVK